MSETWWERSAAGPLRVSVIMPVYNAAGTVTESLESVLAQTFAEWEVIVVDDGSSDGTVETVAGLTRTDARIRLVLAPHAGVCAARNVGLGRARYEWVLFLDADDLILTDHLTQLTGVLASDSSLDAAYCAWARLSPDGGWVTRVPPPPDRLAETLRIYTPFPIHTLVLRRRLVEAVGGWDVTLKVYEDWDLWQRIARAGARFGAIPAVLALYRMRADSVSLNPTRGLVDGLRVIQRVHGFDPRVRNPAGSDRVDPDSLPVARCNLLCSRAGLAIGSGGDAVSLVDSVEDLFAPALDARLVAGSLFEATLLPACRRPAQWFGEWPRLQGPIKEFLALLERRTGAVGLQHGVLSYLQGHIVWEAEGAGSISLGTNLRIALDVEQPIPDVQCRAEVERLRCRVSMGGEYLGVVELPVADGLVPGYVLRDAIAAEFGLMIMRRYLRENVPEAVEQRRGLTDADTEPLRQPGDERALWIVFLEELWGRSGWTECRFYDPDALNEPAPEESCADGWVTVEVSEPLPHVAVGSGELRAVVTVGGSAIGVVSVASTTGHVDAQTLRATITRIAGFELCRAAVREGLLGRPLGERGSLRERLASAARRRLVQRSDLPEGWSGLVFSRLLPEQIDAPTARRVALPWSARGDLEAAALASRQPVLKEGSGLGPGRIIYAPDRIQGRTGVKGGGSISFRQPSRRTWRGPVTDRLPILAYRHIGAATPGSLAQDYVSLEAFAAQLGYLREMGYQGVDLDVWRDALQVHSSLPGRAVLITFDHGYGDFVTNALPILRRFDFAATVFVVAARVGRSWVCPGGEVTEYLGWHEITGLRDQGVEIGSHSLCHASLITLPPAEIVREAAGSRALLHSRGIHARAFAYPFGHEDPAVRLLIGACGYSFGLTGRRARSGIWDAPLALPRIEITGADTLDTFVEKLET